MLGGFHFKSAWASKLGRFFFGMSVLVASACSSKSDAPLTESQKLYARGKAVYQANCTACHNANPHLAGAVGPDLFGSSQALIEARVLHLAYPPGYTPKRKTGAMNKFPQLEADIPALAAFLNDQK